VAGSFSTDGNTQIIRSLVQPISATHAEYQYWASAWKKIRHCIIGEYEIKRHGTTYLPKMESQTDDEYLSYLDRAYFYNMTHRTVNGLVGTVFRREPKIFGIDESIKKNLDAITKDNLSLNIFAKEIASEILSVGRFGVLLDMDKMGKNPPFFVGYVAERIIDWTVEEVDGRFVLTRVVLQEVKKIDLDKVASQPLTTITSIYKADYRVLILENGVYAQHVFKDLAEPPSPANVSEDIITPMKLGKTFNFIPFMFFGPLTNSPGVEKSPILDIALMNISHYQSVAQLEHGRFYTALPVYHVQVQNENEKKGSYVVGPNTVWEYCGDKAPGISEYNGSGLTYLERALDMKESHISALGGRMLGVRATAVAESDNLVKLKEKNEQSLLLNATTTINVGLSKLLQWWADWQNKKFDEAEIALNQDFLFNNFAAREFRAFTLMYQEGILPIDVLYSLLGKSEVIPEDMSLEEFRKQLDDPKNFPNNPDIAAKRDGFTDASLKIRDAQVADQRDLDVELLELQIAADKTAATITLKKAEKDKLANKPKPTVV
jgi:hypothetical protein